MKCGIFLKMLSMIESEEELRQLKRLYDEGLLKDEDYIEKLKEIIKRKEKLKKSVDEQRDMNLNFATKYFTVKDLLFLIDSTGY